MKKMIIFEKRNTAQHSATQRNTAQHSATQRNTAQHVYG